MKNLSDWSYEELKLYLVICYYSCAHDEANEVLHEMKKRKEYYDED